MNPKKNPNFGIIKKGTRVPSWRYNRSRVGNGPLVAGTFLGDVTLAPIPGLAQTYYKTGLEYMRSQKPIHDTEQRRY